MIISDKPTHTGPIGAALKGPVCVDLDPVLRWWGPGDKLLILLPLVPRNNCLNKNNMEGVINHSEDDMFQRL